MLRNTSPHACLGIMTRVLDDLTIPLAKQRGLGRGLASDGKVVGLRS